MKTLFYSLIIALFLSMGIQACNEPSKGDKIEVQSVETVDCGPEPSNHPTPNGYWECNNKKWTWVPDIGRSSRDTVIIDTLKK